METPCAEHGSLRSECRCGVYSLHKFPCDPDLRLQWTASIRRKDFVVTKNSRVCSVHFVDGRPTKLNPTPMLSMGYQKKVTQGRREITKHPLPSSSRCVDGENDSIVEVGRSDTEYKQPEAMQLGEETNVKLSIITLVEAAHNLEKFRAPASQCLATTVPVAQDTPLASHKAVQTMDPMDSVRIDHSYHKKGIEMTSVETQTVASSVSVYQGLTESDCHFYTGISLEAFTNLVTAVESLHHPPCSMCTADQVLLTLMRLRLGLLYDDLARRFSISRPQCGKIFRYMVVVLGRILSEVIVWLPRETIQANMPVQFIEGGYQGTTCIIDCSEVYMQRPKVLYSRGQTFSHYKHCNTMKFLIAVAPDGYIMFASGAYGGRASDKFIVEDSDFCAYLSPYDEIMADRGFGLTEDMKVKGVKLNVPAFCRGKSQFSEEEATRSRRISTLRIHVERAINRIKTYRIFKQPLPIHHKKLMNSILMACAGLCNLKGPLIADRHAPEEEEERSGDELEEDMCLF
ncbi:uncharacterized protein LOC135397507 [Ornithodoros turicata]|uniref:uncharacterized protein LOC135397507 n=1 Tax=Ornithodoros turicata TaxID=34597 RepID=UPI0031386447